MSTQTLSQPIVSAKTNTAVRIVIGLVLSLASGIMLTAAFAPYNAWPLIFVAFPVALFILYLIGISLSASV